MVFSEHVYFYGLDAGKHVFGVSDQVKLKTTCSAKETSQKIEVLHVDTGVILFLQRKT